MQVTREIVADVRLPSGDEENGTTGKRLRTRGRVLLSLGALLFLGLSACATIPRGQIPQGASLTALLPQSAVAYASVQVAHNATLVSDVLEKSGLAKTVPISVVDRTSQLYAAVQSRGGGGQSGGSGGQQGRANGPVYSLVAAGSFPLGAIGWKLSLSPHWKRRSTPTRWWENRRYGTQIAVPNRSLLMLSNGALPTMLGRLTKGKGGGLGPQIESLFRRSDLAIYFPRLSGNIPLFGMSASRFPVDSVYLVMNRDTASGSGAGASNGGYHGHALFKMKNARDARLFSVVFKLLIAGAATGSRIRGFPIPLSGAQLELNGATIRLNGITIGTKALASLLSDVITGRSPGQSS